MVQHNSLPDSSGSMQIFIFLENHIVVRIVTQELGNVPQTASTTSNTTRSEAEQSAGGEEEPAPSTNSARVEKALVDLIHGIKRTADRLKHKYT